MRIVTNIVARRNDDDIECSNDAIISETNIQCYYATNVNHSGC